MEPPVLYHWDSKGKAYIARLLMAESGLDYQMVRLGVDCDFATEIKQHTPFGQAPFLTHGPLKIGQSGAISRYIAKIGGLSGGSDADFAMSEMLLCEADDILAILAGAKYRNGNTAKAWDAALDEQLPPHYANLEKLLRPGARCFTAVGPCAGDIAIFAALDIVMDLDPRLIAGFPLLTAFFRTISSLPSLQATLAADIPIYYKRTVHPPAAEEEESDGQPQQQQSGMPISDYGVGISGRRVMQEPGGTSTLQLFG
eukprot:m.133974 g.133974  ORF g.133974 m.133974 type:complete len:256 (+) comp22512_c0_seq1:119-886(+)